MRKVYSRAATVLLAAAIALVGNPGIATAADATPQQEAINSFPMRHMKISSSPTTDGGTERPAGTVWVSFGDDTATGSKKEHAVEQGATFVRDPKKCDATRLCIWSWVQTDNEVRVFTRWRDQSCVLIGSTLAAEHTRINCGGLSQSF